MKLFEVNSQHQCHIIKGNRSKSEAEILKSYAFQAICMLSATLSTEAKETISDNVVKNTVKIDGSYLINIEDKQIKSPLIAKITPLQADVFSNDAHLSYSSIQFLFPVHRELAKVLMIEPETARALSTSFLEIAHEINAQIDVEKDSFENIQSRFIDIFNESSRHYVATKYSNYKKALLETMMNRYREKMSMNHFKRTSSVPKYINSASGRIF